MKNNDAKDGDGQTNSNLAPSTLEAKATEKKGKSGNAAKETSKHNKWTLKQHWKTATRKQQVVWVCEGITGFIGILVVLGTCYSYISSHQPALSIAVPVQIDHGAVMSFAVRVDNANDVEASSFVGRCDPFIDDKSFTDLGAVDTTVPAAPTSFAGHNSGIICGAKMSSQDIAKITNGGVLRIFVHLSYSGFLLHHNLCEKEQYNPNFGIFSDLGPCNLSKPFPY